MLDDDSFDVALDIDSTLAATACVALDLLGDDAEGLGYSDIEAWDWGTEKFGTARYLNALWHAWTLRPHEIEPMSDQGETDAEMSVGDFSSELQSVADSVDAVTSHPQEAMGIDESKQRWLDRHAVVYDDYVSQWGQPKTELGYDLYVDDKPGLVEEVSEPAVVVQFGHTYNTHMVGPAFSWVVSFRGAVDAVSLRKHEYDAGIVEGYPVDVLGGDVDGE